MSFETESPQTLTISFISSCGKTVFGLRIFYSRAHFQERNYRENSEVPYLLVTCLSYSSTLTNLYVTPKHRFTVNDQLD
jgi:hypothetical protein